MLNAMGKQFVEHSGMGDIARDQGLRRVDEELQEAAGAQDHYELATELADVVLTVAALAAAWGIDLDSALLNKHYVNMLREWQPHPTIPGAVKRVKGTGPR